MKIIAFLLSALLFSGAAQSDAYRQNVRYAPNGQVRVVHNVAHHNVRIVATRVNRARVTVAYRLPRPIYRRVAYRAHDNSLPRAFTYGVYERQFHRHNAYCHH